MLEKIYFKLYLWCSLRFFSPDNAKIYPFEWNVSSKSGTNTSTMICTGGRRKTKVPVRRGAGDSPPLTPWPPARQPQCPKTHVREKVLVAVIVRDWVRVRTHPLSTTPRELFGGNTERISSLLVRQITPVISFCMIVFCHFAANARASVKYYYLQLYWK